MCKILTLPVQQNVDDNMIMCKILSTLPEKYKHFTTAWDSTPTNEKTLTKLTARLMAEEARLQGKEAEEISVAFVTNEKCFKCKKAGHFAKNCKSSQAGIKCFKCGLVGHLAKACHKTNSANVSAVNQCKICKKINHKEEDCYFRKQKIVRSGSVVSESRPAQIVIIIIIDGDDGGDVGDDGVRSDFEDLKPQPCRESLRSRGRTLGENGTATQIIVDLKGNNAREHRFTG
ncbi:Zinc knuckle [Popillia japonica]|uniref:Zinc knuckle n=1 Tax=Popillia japonica TaxID=7064 RepID=A0AAW1JYX4_POPJA